MSKRMTIMPDPQMEQAPADSAPTESDVVCLDTMKVEGDVRSTLQKVLLPEDVELAARLAKNVESDRLRSLPPFPSRYDRETGVEL